MEFLCFMWISGQIANFALHNMKMLFSHPYRASLYYQNFIYSPTAAPWVFLKNIKIYINFYIKTTPTYYSLLPNSTTNTYTNKDPINAATPPLY